MAVKASKISLLVKIDVLASRRAERLSLRALRLIDSLNSVLVMDLTPRHRSLMQSNLWTEELNVDFTTDVNLALIRKSCRLLLQYLSTHPISHLVR